MGNSPKLLTTNKVVVSTIFFTNINISFFNLRFDLFSIIAKIVNHIRNNVVCVVARLVFVSYCALTMGHCISFQRIFVIFKKNRMLFLATMINICELKIYSQKSIKFPFAKTSLRENKPSQKLIQLR